MKRILLSSVIFLAINSSLGARADTYGCTVMLCTASGAVPWQSAPACAPSVSRALSGLSAGISWPTCPEAGAYSNSTQIRQEIINAGDSPAFNAQVQPHPIWSEPKVFSRASDRRFSPLCKTHNNLMPGFVLIIWRLFLT